MTSMKKEYRQLLLNINDQGHHHVNKHAHTHTTNTHTTLMHTTTKTCLKIIQYEKIQSDIYRAAVRQISNKDIVSAKTYNTIKTTGPRDREQCKFKHRTKMC